MMRVVVCACRSFPVVYSLRLGQQEVHRSDHSTDTLPDRHAIEFDHDGTKIVVTISATKTSSWGMTYMAYEYECMVDGTSIEVRLMCGV
eukprot:SAG11_NODE_10979_length_792_cov_1.007215_1_plen_89_part_00